MISFLMKNACNSSEGVLSSRMPSCVKYHVNTLEYSLNNELLLAYVELEG